MFSGVERAREGFEEAGGHKGVAKMSGPWHVAPGSSMTYFLLVFNVYGSISPYLTGKSLPCMEASANKGVRRVARMSNSQRSILRPRGAVLQKFQLRGEKHIETKLLVI